jgi:hypothetical protein
MFLSLQGGRKRWGFFGAVQIRLINYELISSLLKKPFFTGWSKMPRCKAPEILRSEAYLDVRRNDERRGVPLRRIRSNSLYAREKVSGLDNAADGLFFSTLSVAQT